MTAWQRHERIGECDLYLGDCLEVMPHLGRFDAVVTDPPYGKVKGDFDKAWTNRASMLTDARQWAEAMIEKMEPNASLYWFAWPSLAGRIEAILSEHLNILNHIVWEKPAATGQKTSKESLRAFMPLTERIIFAEKYGADNWADGSAGYSIACDRARGFIFEPIRYYLDSEWRALGLTYTDANKATGTQMASHWFSKNQWALPTEKNYRKLQERAREGLRREYEGLRREYEGLRREYEGLRREYEELRRWFDCRPGDQFGDVWRFKPNSDAFGHPTVKPIELMAYIIRVSVRPYGCALDPFMGSGTTGVACVQLGRRFTGIELDPEYFEIACRRIEAEVNAPRLDLPEPPPKPTQPALFGGDE
jgi:adenine-specific DNA-methyltransferase